MDCFTIELISNAFLNCYPTDSFSSFAKLLPEKINLKGEWELANSEKSPFIEPKRY